MVRPFAPYETEVNGSIIRARSFRSAVWEIGLKHSPVGCSSYRDPGALPKVLAYSKFLDLALCAHLAFFNIIRY